MTAAAVPSVLLYNSFADPKKGFAGYCAASVPDWNGERSGLWPGRHSKVCAPFRDGSLRPERVGDDRGRGLFSGVAVAAGEPICAAQPPLALHQYEESRMVCQVCSHCGRFVGSLRSALCRPLEALKATSGGRTGLELPRIEELVENMTDLDELEVGDWQLSPCLPCEHGCGAVFCGPDCVAASRLEGWHRVVCSDLEPERRPVWRRLRAHGLRHHEPIILAAQVIAEIVCLVKHHGVELFEAMSYFTRFAKMSWLSMLSLPSRSTTQVLPEKGCLAEMATVKRQKRYEILTTALDMLMALFWERQFAELLTVDFFSNLVGQFSLSNAWVQLEHPLTQLLSAQRDNVEFRRRFGKLIAASARAAEALADPSEEDRQKGTPEVTTEGPRQDEMQIEDSDDSSAWALPRFQGSGLFVCCALANHSCEPSFTLHYSDGGLTTMIALRDIEVGEELTLAYVSPFYDLNERLVNLWRTWGFVCTCRKCQDQLMTRIMEKGTEISQKRGDTSSVAISSTDSRSGTAPAIAGLSAAGVAAAVSVVTARSRGTSPCSSAKASPRMPATPLSQPHDRESLLSPVALTKAQEEEEDDDEEDEDEDEEDDDEEEEEEEEEDSEGSSDGEDFEGGALAGLNPYISPLGQRAPPPSVLKLEADLKRMMQIMNED